MKVNIKEKVLKNERKENKEFGHVRG